MIKNTIHLIAWNDKFLTLPVNIYVCTCVRACLRAHMLVRVRVRASMLVHVRVRVRVFNVNF